MIVMATALLKRMFINDMIGMATALLKRMFPKRHGRHGDGAAEVHVAKAT